MSELQIIQSALDQAARRRRWGRALRGMWIGLLAGAALSLTLIGIYHLVPLPFPVVLAAGLLPLPALLLGLAIGGWRRPTLPEVARWVDNRQGLQERLSTALEISGADPGTNAWSTLVVTDAAHHVQGLDFKRMLPFHLPKATRWALIVLVLAAGLGFVPEYRSKSYRQKKADEANIKEAGRQLAELTRHNLDKRKPAEPTIQKSMESVAALGDQLAHQTLSRSDALKDLANVTERLKDQLRDLSKDPSLKRMEQAARGSMGGDSQNARALQKQIDALQKQLGSPTGNPDAMDRLQKNLEKLKEAARGLPDKNSPGSEAERQKLAESLSALSRQAQDMGLALPQLDEAINALAANQTDLMLKDLQAATKDLDKLRDMAKSLSQLQQQMAKLGKDLGEQLKNGQPEAAQQTMQKMISQLNAANLTPEQLQQLQAEIDKAVDPASNYGKVAEKLKAASKKMQASDKNGAAKDLAAASKELDSLMQQIGDAQELQATLDALKGASMMIGTGQGWRLNNGPPQFGEGGEPGSGVGTWADETAQWDGKWSNGWDNSGVTQDTMDPRGITDRGEGQLNEALKPTKVRGQFSPGSQMPSITLKGVSIRGTSTVAYEEAASAAQSDAQSALSQEKVPRAYQGAVKDYFDDLKK